MTDFPELQALVKRMGARLSLWQPETDQQRRERGQLERELQRGIEVDNLGEVKPYDGLLTYKGEQIVIYIKDNTHLDQFTLLINPKEAKRFHIAECQTIMGMRKQGRSDRYVMTKRQDGTFLVEAKNRDGAIEEFDASLYVCKHCLTQLDWKGYNQRTMTETDKNKLWEEFSLQDFFAKFTTFFSPRPRDTDLTALPADYAKDWRRLSSELKRQRGWRCDECGINLSAPAHKKLLHGHHKNGVKRNNSPENIAVLCLLCHSKQPYHGRVQPSKADRKIIESLRNEQQSQSQTR